MLLQDVDVIAGGVEGRDPVAGPLAPVVAVIVVGADQGAALRPQDLGDAARQGGLAGGAVPDDAG